ncbi:efflux transporter outer membrane subunit [Gluconacetobacter diazotrophicus]|uniref:Efflux transporter outer membrane subunit n=1 Tax=Gluconacetobacter diazotrophicus TaxID=33996 RepID=A0A7W4I5U7_GLUDI|nr:efflux transporter outer membrane subunit [Gluconacetobacter diazotrophicus]MBB2156799.1 efflux transporter outer membrane subunit [Gluconacetobacter diazotrophicus]
MIVRSLRRTVMSGGAMLSLAALSACDLAPTYHPPTYVVPASWHGQAPFATATPADTQLPSNWWTMLHDPQLDALEDKATAANADLQAAAERFVQARAMVMQARADLLPHFGLAFGASDNKQSADRLFRYKGATTATDEFYGGLASWEPDFWSEIRNQVRMAKYSAQEKAADFAAARLSLQAELANDYVALRGYDAQDAIYRKSIAYYERAVSVTQTQLANQAAPKLDLARAQNRLYVTQAAEMDILAEREVTEHAIAVLTNSAPSSFHIAPVDTLTFTRAAIPVGVPSDLLQRRPDVAAAERQMAQANRSIGVSRAAFYPHISLNANGGFDANGFDLANLANSMWSYGASASMPIFEGGLRRAALQASWSTYRETRDHYRSSVLSAFREVEDGLSRTDRLWTENDRLKAAVSAALDMQNMTMTLYKGGLSPYLDAIIAQEAALDAQISQVQVETRYVQAEVGLIRALGGGWNDRLLPTPDQTMTFSILQYDGLHHPTPAGGIDTPGDTDTRYDDLTGATTLRTGTVPVSGR